MPYGEIKRLQTETGIGFICQTGMVEDLMFHATALAEGTFDQLREGQGVEFERRPYANAPTKYRAVNIRPLRGTR